MKYKKVILMMLFSLIFIVGCAEKIKKVAEEKPPLSNDNQKIFSAFS